MSEEEQSNEQEETKTSSQEDLEREEREAKEEVKQLEEDPPEKLEDWPKGKAMYETFGGAEGQDHAYHEGPEQKLGPDSLRHREDGEVEIGGEKVDNPDEYKGEPIPGGPTDPSSPDAPGKPALADDEGSSDDDESSQDDS